MGVILASNGQAHVAVIGALNFNGQWVYLELTGNRTMMKSILATLHLRKYVSLRQDSLHVGGGHGVPFRAHAINLDSTKTGVHVLLLGELDEYITCYTPDEASEAEINHAIFDAVINDPDVVLPARLAWADVYCKFAREARMIQYPGVVLGEVPVHAHFMKKDAGWIGLLDSLIKDGAITL